MTLNDPYKGLKGPYGGIEPSFQGVGVDIRNVLETTIYEAGGFRLTGTPPASLGLQVAQRMSCLQFVGINVGTTHILFALGFSYNPITEGSKNLEL